MMRKHATVFRFSMALLFLWSMMFIGTSPALAQNLFRPPDPPSAKTTLPPQALRLMTLTEPLSPLASTIGVQFEGMSQTSTIRPPDPHGAAGTDGILQTVNLRIQYFTKAGTSVWGPVALSTFFGISGSGTSDPRVVFDAATQRFYVILQENTNTQAFVNLAVSKTANPASSGSSDWYFYRPEITQRVGNQRYGADYPGLGVDGQALYVTYNMYKLPFSSGSTFRDCQVVIFNKANINSGTLGSGFPKKVFTPNGSSNGFTLQPATVMGGTPPSNTAYLGETSLSSTTAVRVWTLTNPLTSPSLSSTTITVPNNGGYIGSAPQCGTSTTVATLSPRTQGNACWYNGAIWFTHTAGGSSGKAIVYYYKVNTSGMTLAESGGINGGTGVSTYQPSVGVSSNGSVAIVYTQSSSTQCPTMVYVSRTAAATAFDAPVAVKASPSFSNSDRWGDYASVTGDPVDNSLWLTHEWAKTNALHNWSTWWANVTATAPLGPALTDAKEISQTVMAEAEPVPTSYGLDQNYPNPFNPITAISFQLPVESQVVLKIYDIVGREVATLVDEVVSAGYKQVFFNATNLSSGTYFYRLQANDFTDIKKMTLMK
jgi:hypothetical protein